MSDASLLITELYHCVICAFGSCAGCSGHSNPRKSLFRVYGPLSSLECSDILPVFLTCQAWEELKKRFASGKRQLTRKTQDPTSCLNGWKSALASCSGMSVCLLLWGKQGLTSLTLIGSPHKSMHLAHRLVSPDAGRPKMNSWTC